MNPQGGTRGNGRSTLQFFSAKPTATAALLLATLGVAGVAPAVDRVWSGVSNVSFFTPEQWSPAGVPQPSDHLTITAGIVPMPYESGLLVNDGGSILLSGPTAGLGKMTYPATWQTANTAWIGESGVGSVRVENGAALTTMNTRLGRYAGSVGTVTVTGLGSTWNVGVTEFSIGAYDGTGVVNLLDHARIDYFSDFAVSTGTNSKGFVTVDNATLNTPGLAIGAGGQASFVARNGATVQAYITYISQYGTAAAEATFDGVGTTVVNKLPNGQLGGSTAVGRTGTGTLNVTNGAVITNYGDLFVGRDASVVFTGGHGIVKLAGDGARVKNFGNFRTGGAAAEVFLGTGTRIDSVGDTVLTATTDLTFTAGLPGTPADSLADAVADAGVITANGTATLAGDLFFNAAPGYTPAPGTVFVLLTASGFTGQFASFTSNVPAELIYGGTAVSVRIIPEPTAVLAGVICAGLLLRRRVRGATVL